MPGFLLLVPTARWLCCPPVCHVCFQSHSAFSFMSLIVCCSGYARFELALQDIFGVSQENLLE